MTTATWFARAVNPESVHRIGLDFQAGFRDARAVGAGEVAPAGERLGGTDLQFARLGQLVIFERRLPESGLALVIGHSVPPDRSFGVSSAGSGGSVLPP